MPQLIDTTTIATSTPPVAVATANFMGMGLPDLVQLATLAYLGLLILHKCWQIFKEWRAERAQQETNSTEIHTERNHDASSQ